MPDVPRQEGEPDLDLLEYVLVAAPSAAGLDPVATAVAALVDDGAIRVLDAVVLVRPAGETSVRTAIPEASPALRGLARLARPAPGGSVLLSPHDVELAAVTLDPGQTALLLLVEDRWAGALSDAARSGGARLTAGERIPGSRVAASLAGSGVTDLLLRGPGALPVGDQAAQVHRLARLVDRGLLTLDRYDVQRRRVLGG